MTGSAPARGRARGGVVVVALAVALVVAGAWALLAPPAGPGMPTRVVGDWPVTAMDQSLNAANNSPMLAADPTEDRFVVMATRLDAPDFGCALQLSGDGGRSWTTSAVLPALPEGAEKCYGPEVAFDAGGRLHFLFVGLAGAGNEPMGAYLTHSDDRARSFAPPRRVLGPLSFAVRLAVDPGTPGGRLHLVWIEARSDPGLGSFGPPPNPIRTAHSDDGGATFSEPVVLAGGAGQRVVAPALAVAGERVVVAYYDLRDDARDYHNLEGPTWEGPWSLEVLTSQDGGGTFGPPSPVDEVTPPDRPVLVLTMAPPALAVGPGRRICVAWTDARAGDPDVMARCSSAGTPGWDGPSVRVNDDPPGTGRRQYLPGLAASPTGRLDVVFYDRRRDVGNATADVFLSSSRDGRRFSPNVRLTSEPSPTSIGPEYAGHAAAGQREIGSRLGLLSRPAGAVAAWTDTRNSLARSTGQDVFAGVVEAGRGRPPWYASPGGALVAGGAAALAAAARARRRPSDPVPIGTG